MTEKEITRVALIMLLKRKRQGMTPAERAKRKKPARWLYPWATEHGYAVLIRAWVKPVIVFVREYIQKHHEAVLRGDGADAVVRKDAVAGESFQMMFESLWNWCDIYISNKDNEKAKSQIWLGLGRIADEAFDFNEAQFNKAFKASLGINFPSDQSWWPAARDLWRERNYDLIRSDIRKYISEINDQTEKAVTNGWSVKSLMKEIQSLDEKITKSRANFIARDQMGKLNGLMTQKRQEDIGLTMYEWSSSGDERVRSSHALMDGKLCLWDDATVCSEDGGKTWKPRPAGAVLMHPGQDYQCRCCALAWFDELIDEADDATGGRTGGILDKPTKEQERFANDYYEEIRNRKHKSDVKSIAANTGMSVSSIAKIRNHIFINEHTFEDGSVKRFDADVEIALAWQRLDQNRFNDLDLILLKHELKELTIMRKKGYYYEKAHWLASKKYPWQFLVDKNRRWTDDTIQAEIERQISSRL